MTHYDVSFRLQHDCPYNSFSRKHPEVVISHWCNLSRDVLEISHRNVKTETVQRSIGVLVKELGTRGGRLLLGRNGSRHAEHVLGLG